MKHHLFAGLILVSGVACLSAAAFIAHRRPQPAAMAPDVVAMPQDTPPSTAHPTPVVRLSPMIIRGRSIQAAQRPRRAPRLTRPAAAASGVRPCSTWRSLGPKFTRVEPDVPRRVRDLCSVRVADGN